MLSTSRRTPHTKRFSEHMACTSSAAPCAAAPTISWRDASATRASLSSLSRAPALLKSTPYLGGKLAQLAGSKMRRTRAAPIARAQAVSTSAPKVGDVSEDVAHGPVAGLASSSLVHLNFNEVSSHCFLCNYFACPSSIENASD